MKKTQADPTRFIGIAFLRGNPRDLWDQVVMRSTWGGFVHTEIFLQNEQGARFYTACSPLGSGFIPSVRVEGLVPLNSRKNWPATQKETLPNFQDRWKVISFPLASDGGYETAYALILQILAMQLPYNNKDLWQCCLQVMLPFERDLDCNNLETWRTSGVFCSQVCLLILRRLSRNGCIAIDPDTERFLENINSRGCSPNKLYHLLSRMNPEKKLELTGVGAGAVGGKF